MIYPAISHNTHKLLKLILLLGLFVLVSFLVGLKANAQTSYPPTIRSVDVIKNQNETSIEVSASGERPCQESCMPRTNTLDASTYGWVEKISPEPKSVVVPPTDPQMGEQYFPFDGPFIWRYARSVDISSWANGEYRFCVMVNGNLDAFRAPGLPNMSNIVSECANFSITSHSPQGSYTLTLQPFQEMLEGGTASYLVSINCLSGFSGSVSSFGFAQNGNPFNDKVIFTFPETISCSSPQGFLVVKSNSGSSPLSPPAEPFVTPQFTVTSSASSVGSQSASASLRIYALPKILSLVANPTQVYQGQNSSLSWNTSSTVSCQASVDWSGAKPLNSSGESTGVLTRLSPDHNYILTCTGALGSNTSASVSVKVLPQPSTLHVNYSLDGTVIESSNLTVKYSISGPSPVPSQYYTIARDHGSLASGTYKLNFETAPAGYVFGSVTPESISLSAGATQTFTLNFSTPTCPASPSSFSLAGSPIRAGDEKTLTVPSGYSGGTIMSSDPSVATVTPSGNSFLVNGLKGGQVTLTGSGWTYSGISCQPKPLTLNIEGFTVTLSPAYTQIQQGESVNSMLVTVGGSFWNGSEVSLSLPSITLPSGPISLAEAIKLCRVTSPSDCIVPMVMVLNTNTAIISFTTSNSAQLGDYQVAVTGKFSNGYSVSGTGILSVIAGSTGGGGSDTTPTPTPTPTFTAPTRTPQVRLDGSDKQIAKINNQTNQLGSNVCLGRTAGIDENKGRLKIGDILSFKVNICNTGTLDVTPTSSNPLIITDTFTNLKIPSSGLKFKFNGQDCNSANNCSVAVSGNQITATITGGTLKSGNYVWNLEYDLLIGVPAGYNSDLIIANNRGIITYGSLQYPYNTGSLVATVDFRNVPKQYEIAP